MLWLLGLQIIVVVTYTTALRITGALCHTHWLSVLQITVVVELSESQIAVAIIHFMALRISDYCTVAITFVTVCRIADYVSHNIYYGSQNY